MAKLLLTSLSRSLSIEEISMQLTLVKERLRDMANRLKDIDKIIGEKIIHDRHSLRDISEISEIAETKDLVFDSHDVDAFRRYRGMYRAYCIVLGKRFESGVNFKV